MVKVLHQRVSVNSFRALTHDEQTQMQSRCSKFSLDFAVFALKGRFEKSDDSFQQAAKNHGLSIVTNPNDFEAGTLYIDSATNDHYITDSDLRKMRYTKSIMAKTSEAGAVAIR